MKILVAYHSKTGNTKTFAEMIAQALRDSSHDADLHQLQTTEPLPDNVPPGFKNFTIKPGTDPADYDAIFLGGPVWAFSSAPVALKYCNELANLNGKLFMPFTTMAFPFSFLGGNRTLRQLAKPAASKGMKILPGSVICYMKRDPELQMQKELDRITKLI